MILGIETLRVILGGIGYKEMQHKKPIVHVFVEKGNSDYITGILEIYK
jgi:hypothetical protein